MSKIFLLGTLVLMTSSFSSSAEVSSGKEKIKVTFTEECPFPLSPLLFGTQAEVWVMPYLSKEQLQYYKGLGVTLLRYPSGTTADWFLWDDMDHGYWPGGTEKRLRMTPDSFIETCRGLGVERIFEVNTSFHDVFDDAHRINPTKDEDIRKGAEYAAKWVKDVNVKKKHGVKYWEIGNEVWIWMQAKENAAHVSAYSDGMRKVDPSIKIIACGLANDSRGFSPDWLNRAFKNDPTWKPRLDNRNTAEAWAKALLYQARGKFDYIALHVYLGPGESKDVIENGRETFSQIVDFKGFDQHRTWIKEAKSPARLAVTEWMTNFYHCTIIKKEKDYYLTSPAYSFVNTLLAADFFGKMMSTGLVDIAVAHDMTDMLGDAYCDPTGKVLNPPLELPAGAAMRFWKTFSGDRVLKVNVGDCPSYEFKGVKVPVLSAYATVKGKESKKIFLVLINRSPTENVNISINGILKERTITGVIEHTLSAPSWSTTVWAGMENSKLFPFKNSDQAIKVSDLKNYTVKPSKLTCLEITSSPKTAPARQVFKNVLIIGNSITRHEPQADLGWKNNCGMAATNKDNDFAHLLYKRN